MGKSTNLIKLWTVLGLYYIYVWCVCMTVDQIVNMHKHIYIYMCEPFLINFIICKCIFFFIEFNIIWWRNNLTSVLNSTITSRIRTPKIWIIKWRIILVYIVFHLWSCRSHVVLKLFLIEHVLSFNKWWSDIKTR